LFLWLGKTNIADTTTGDTSRKMTSVSLPAHQSPQKKSASVGMTKNCTSFLPIMLYLEQYLLLLENGKTGNYRLASDNTSRLSKKNWIDPCLVWVAREHQGPVKICRGLSIEHFFKVQRHISFQPCHSGSNVTFHNLGLFNYTTSRQIYSGETVPLMNIGNFIISLYIRTPLSSVLSLRTQFYHILFQLFNYRIEYCKVGSNSFNF
jgi:hypothetical protein